MARTLAPAAVAGILFAAQGARLLAQDGSIDSFELAVLPVFEQSCGNCHNNELMSGGMNIAVFANAETLLSDRDGWERILARVRSGEMPPPGVPRPLEDQLSTFVSYVEAEFAVADANMVPDPGRVTARRLNRAEYSNTVRDLLGVDFRATDEFPPDDSGYGFDNIADLLTVSPTLMQQYLAAAERIAARAVGGDPLPQPGFFNNRARTRRIDPNSLELIDIVDYDADYIVRVNLNGHRGDDDPPVRLRISVDGEPIGTFTVPVEISQVNRQGGATQRSSYEARVFLPANEHRFRADFIDDAGLANIEPRNYRNVRENIFPNSIEIAGPYPPEEPRTVRKKALICDPASGRECVDRILTTLARRAYRRPVERNEVDRLREVFDEASASGYTPHQSLQFAITAMLVSPQFLFRIERDPEPGQIRPIGDIELASRLSYFLWSSMPDDELLSVAEADTLHLPLVLDYQVRRMIQDPKSTGFAENFVGQWLETRSLDAVTRDDDLFPESNAELKDAMAAETRLFFESVLRRDRPVSDFIDGNYTFLNERLAEHYGIEGVEGEEFRMVELATDERSGVLTHGSVLTVSSYPTRTSVVLRGKYLLENVLASPPPPPPADVPALDEEAVGIAESLRDQMERHRSDPACASCHAPMDPLGFALENYDAIGRWRIQDGEFPIDASGSFPNGRQFSGPTEMKALLLESLPAFAESIAEKMMTYALGRGMESSYDRLVIRNLAAETAANDFRMQSLILGIVRSELFQQRRAAEDPPIRESLDR